MKITKYSLEYNYKNNCGYSGYRWLLPNDFYSENHTPSWELSDTPPSKKEKEPVFNKIDNVKFFQYSFHSNNMKNDKRLSIKEMIEYKNRILECKKY